MGLFRRKDGAKPPVESYDDRAVMLDSKLVKKLREEEEFGNTSLVENEKQAEKESVIFKKFTKEIKDFLSFSKPFTSEEDFKNKIFSSGMVLPVGDGAYNYALLEDPDHKQFPSREMAINKVRFADGEKQVRFKLEFRKGLDGLPCFFYHKDNSVGKDLPILVDSKLDYKGKVSREKLSEIGALRESIENGDVENVGQIKDIEGGTIDTFRKFLLDKFANENFADKTPKQAEELAKKVVEKIVSNFNSIRFDQFSKDKKEGLIGFDKIVGKGQVHFKVHVVFDPKGGFSATIIKI